MGVCVYDSTMFLFFGGATAQSCPPTLEDEGEEQGEGEEEDRVEESEVNNAELVHLKSTHRHSLASTGQQGKGRSHSMGL